MAEAGPRARRRVPLALKIVAGALGGLLVLSIGGFYLVTDHLAGQVHRYPGVFTGLDEATRPPATAALNVLLIGSDSLADEPTTGTEAAAPEYQPGAQRSDAIMLVHIDASRHEAAVISFPRDSWVNVPGHGDAKINASFSYGGPTLLVRTVEGLTGLRIGHFAVIDFAGFQALTDAVGGIDVTVDETTTFGAQILHAGRNHLDGAEALGYVRQREDLPGGDLGRVRRHQSALRALLAKGTADPLQTYRFLDELTRWITVDETMTNAELHTLTWQLRDLSPNSATFLTIPVAGLGREGEQSVVYPDSGRCAELWRFVRDDDIAGYVRAHPGIALGRSTP